jgi:hypothetical protein
MSLDSVVCVHLCLILWRSRGLAERSRQLQVRSTAAFSSMALHDIGGTLTTAASCPVTGVTAPMAKALVVSGHLLRISSMCDKLCHALFCRAQAGTGLRSGACDAGG